MALGIFPVNFFSSTKGGYKCTGNISGWTSCTYLTQTPKRKMWVVPEELENDFL